ncbi:coat protein [ssRNA phage Zoerhiza.1_22]|uniref:Coat protein n=2 Tax=Leviviricetes TaxID=2842243 RepID=A0A8S5KZ59_9VIRU|nr:coat protein [ssRNA phage Zoerhiza.1_22]QDH86444.1 MAG: hypothetical protein H1Rhizo25979_000002 [Leviviridae sp.]DAD50130.1 TPA_asm: coat protein [ssRNA phage Zoerhiza.1_22]
MFSDPISVLYEGAAHNHARTSADNPSTFTYVDETDGVTQTVSVRQTTSKSRFRHEFRISRSKIAADPITLANGEIGASVYLVIDEPRAGFTDTDLNDIAASLFKYLSGAAPSDTTNVLKLLTGEY